MDIRSGGSLHVGVQISSLKREAVGKSESDSVKPRVSPLIEPPKSECVSVSHRLRGGNGGMGWESEGERRGD